MLWCEIAPLYWWSNRGKESQVSAAEYFQLGLGQSLMELEHDTEIKWGQLYVVLQLLLHHLGCQVLA